MEKEGFVRGMGIFDEYELPVEKIVTDQQTAVKVDMRKYARSATQI